MPQRGVFASGIAGGVCVAGVSWLLEWKLAAVIPCLIKDPISWLFVKSLILLLDLDHVTSYDSADYCQAAIFPVCPACLLLTLAISPFGAAWQDNCVAQVNVVLFRLAAWLKQPSPLNQLMH